MNRENIRTVSLIWVRKYERLNKGSSRGVLVSLVSTGQRTGQLLDLF